MPIRRLAALCCLGLAAGCSHKSSSSGGEDGMPIPTSVMHINARVAAEDGPNSIVSVTLDDGRLPLATTTYRLTDGDALRACVLGSCKPLTRAQINDLLPDSYGNTFPFVADVEYSVQLTRTAGTSASSSVTLPPPFDITMPAPGTQFTDGDVFTVAWWPPGTGANVDVRANTSCTYTDGEKTLVAAGFSQGDPDGDGRADIGVDELLKYLDSSRPTSAPVRDCEIQVEVQHSRIGMIDSVFAGGSIRGSQTRSMSLTYVPSR
jgi:hypothetical protein